MKDNNKTNDTGLPNTYIEWKLGGTDGDRYKIEEKTYLTVEESSTTTPVVKITSIDGY